MRISLVMGEEEKTWIKPGMLLRAKHPFYARATKIINVPPRTILLCLEVVPKTWDVGDSGITSGITLIFLFGDQRAEGDFSFHDTFDIDKWLERVG